MTWVSKKFSRIKLKNISMKKIVGISSIGRGGAQFTKSGIPDLLICCNGIFLAIELKGPKGKPSELQLWTIEQIKKAGGFSFVLYPKDFDKFKKLIELLLCDIPSNQKIIY